MFIRLLRPILTIFLVLLTLFTASAGDDFVVVIDPGHGGRDAGALGNRTNEKTVNLLVARKLARLLNDKMDNVKVHLTREGDKFVPLQGRADFANRRHADIFISIHANSVSEKSPARTRVNGAAVYTLGLDRSNTNLTVAMRENEVMKLEDDYRTVYEGFDPSSTESYIVFEMMQHKNMDQSIALAEAVQNQLVRHAGRKNNGVRQAPFWVLVRTSMPAILVELDFICNPAMERFMASDNGSDRLARAIYNGVERYRKSLTGTKPVKDSKKSQKKASEKDAKEKTRERGESEKTSQTETSASSKATQTSSTIYKIQFLTAPKPLKKGDSRLKGLEPAEYYRDGGMVKYTYGSYSSAEEAARALPKVKKKFHDAFVIKTRNGKRIK